MFPFKQVRYWGSGITKAFIFHDLFIDNIVELGDMIHDELHTLVFVVELLSHLFFPLPPT